MRDIRGDLQDRADMFKQQITIENVRFEQVVLQLKTRHDNQLEHLRAQLRLANKLLEFTHWHDNVCATLTARIAVAEVAESSIRNCEVEAGTLPALHGPTRPVHPQYPKGNKISPPPHR
jgi:hypothetical protein